MVDVLLPIQSLHYRAVVFVTVPVVRQHLQFQHGEGSAKQSVTRSARTTERVPVVREYWKVMAMLSKCFRGLKFVAVGHEFVLV